MNRTCPIVPHPAAPILLSVTTGSPDPGRTLRLRGREWPPGSFGIMAVINRTPDSFFDHGSSYEFGAAMAAADQAVTDGASILDIGGVRAGPGEDVTTAEEIRRVTGLVAAIRAQHPSVVISVDTWRAEVGDAVARAGADLLNDVWGGADQGLARVAAAHGLGLVCSHAGGLAPRTRPHRPAYTDVVAEVHGYVMAAAEQAVAAGVRPDRIVIDPAHDFGKNTWQSLELTRHTADLVASGWPVLVAVSNKDFIGESLGLPVAERAEGTIAALAVCAWQGARLFRVHDVPAARDALATVAALRDELAGGRPEGRVKGS
jgi:dihydropteroate synthase